MLDAFEATAEPSEGSVVEIEPAFAKGQPDPSVRGLSIWVFISGLLAQALSHHQ
jgi:hypothetical protein